MSANFNSFSVVLRGAIGYKSIDSSILLIFIFFFDCSELDFLSFKWTGFAKYKFLFVELPSKIMSFIFLCSGFTYLYPGFYD